VVSKIRAQRIAERIREELSIMLLEEVSDPRLSGVSVTDVQIDRELAYANIYVSAVEGSERSREILDGLDHAQGFLRHELTQRIDLRTFPRLRFYWDPTYERAEKVERLFAQIREEEEARRKEIGADVSGESEASQDQAEADRSDDGEEQER
jgi:ribosome-binding factor A